MTSKVLLRYSSAFQNFHEDMVCPGSLAALAVGTQIILRWLVTTTIWPPTSKLNDSMYLHALQ